MRRHFFVTALIQSGCNMKIAQTLAGHHSAAFALDQYADALPQQLEEAGENVASGLAPAEEVVRTSAAVKSHQGAPIFTHPLHHPANATLFPAKSAQEPIESPVFL
jgi:hypothetical protein